jgi:hypothetical protein
LTAPECDFAACEASGRGICERQEFALMNDDNGNMFSREPRERVRCDEPPRCEDDALEPMLARLEPYFDGRRFQDQMLAPYG